MKLIKIINHPMNNLANQTATFLTNLLETQILPDVVKYINTRSDTSEVTVNELMNHLTGAVATTVDAVTSPKTNQPRKCPRKIGRGQQPTRECGKTIIG